MKTVMPEVGDIWYRYSHSTNTLNQEYLIEMPYKVVRITKCGVWLESAYMSDVPQFKDLTLCNHCTDYKQHFVLLNSRKRFAYPTKMEALESLIHRKHSQIKKLMTQGNRAQKALEAASREIEKLKNNS